MPVARGARSMSLHINTPRMSVVDPRGLPVRTVDYCRDIENGPVEPRINRTLHDSAGRAVKHWDPRLWLSQAVDPLTPANLTQVFALDATVIRSDSVDAGTQIELKGLATQTVLSWDSRQTRHEIEHDNLLRPVAIFEEGTGEPRRCVERLTYGHPGSGDQSRNQFGQLIRHDHPAGSVLFNGFAISGPCTEDTRHFTLDPLTPDWSEQEADRLRLLEPGVGATSRWRHGALGDVLEQTDARDNRHTFALTVDGRLGERRLQLKGEPEQVVVTDIRYNAQGNVTRQTAGNGVQTTRTYRSEDDRLLGLRSEDARGLVLQHLSYEYDRMGNILSIEDKALPIRYFANQRIEPVSRFVYDSLYQLTKASGWEAGTANQGTHSMGRIDPAAISNYQQTYEYDPGGNLRNLIHVGPQSHGRKLQPASYSNRSLPYTDAIPDDPEIEAAYDRRGNLLQLEPGRLLSWNLRNQLQSVSPVARVSGLNDQEVYLYDGSRQRVRKIRSSLTNARTLVSDVRYLPGLELRTDSGTGERLQVIIADNARVQHWESPPPSGLNNRYRYQHADHLGSVSLETADDGAMISRETFHPFGTSAWQDGELSYKFVRYSGKERDASGLDYYGYRYYIPWLQKWSNPDPAGEVEGLNLFKMALNNPATLVDLNGLQTGPQKNEGTVSRLRSLFSETNGAASTPTTRPVIRRSPAATALANRSVPVPVAASVPIEPIVPAREVVQAGRSRPVDMPDLTPATGPLPPYASGRRMVGNISLMTGPSGGVIVMRSDNRSPEDIRAAGGFYPKERRGDYKQNFRNDITTQGWSGNARSHVGFSNPRYVSTGIDDNAGGYAGQRGFLYRMEIPGLEERAINDSTLGLAAPMSVKPKSRLDTRLFMNRATLDESDIVAIIPGGTAEMTFISPIPSAFVMGSSAQGTGPWRLFH